MALAAHLQAALESIPGATLRDRGPALSGIVTFTLDGHPAEEIADHLSKAGVNVWVSPGEDSHLDLLPRGLTTGVVQASVHYFNTVEELDRAADLVAALI